MMDLQTTLFSIFGILFLFAPVIICLILNRKNKTLSKSSKIAWVLCCLFASSGGLVIYLAVNLTIKDHINNQPPKA